MSSPHAVDRADALWRLLGALHPGDFAQQPACADNTINPELFYPVSERSPQVQQAKQICCACPVRRSCLDFALKRGEHGIWGGTTDTERHQLRQAALNYQAAIEHDAA